MKKLLICVPFLFTVAALAADDEAALKAQMQKDCAAVFVDGAACSNLAKGSRNCVRQNLASAGAACVAFEKSHQEFFDGGKNDPIIKKQ